jgi:oligopeptide/dipeptide ABC transporter ATP-binding protein
VNGRESLLEVQQVSVTIGSRPVLREVNFVIERGQCVGLVGETGSGKSMTCRVLSGQLGRVGGCVTAGTVNFDGTNLLELGPGEWRRLQGRRIGLVPQNSLSSLDPVMRVGRQLRESIRELDPAVNADDRSIELLDMVRMRDPRRVMKSYSHELSGGMRQRVMIALALAGNPDLLIADEPTTALDATVQLEILELLRELRRANGLAMLLVTHDLALVATVADEIAVMYAGSVIESGPTGAVIAKADHPYARALVAAGQAVAVRSERLDTIPGNPRPLVAEIPGCQFAPRCPIAGPRCALHVPTLLPSGPSRNVACFVAQEQQ